MPLANKWCISVEVIFCPRTIKPFLSGWLSNEPSVFVTWLVFTLRRWRRRSNPHKPLKSDCWKAEKNDVKSPEATFDHISKAWEEGRGGERRRMKGKKSFPWIEMLSGGRIGGKRTRVIILQFLWSSFTPHWRNNTKPFWRGIKYLNVEEIDFFF